MENNTYIKAQNSAIVFINGSITFKTSDTQATTGIKWKTVGFTITRVPCLSASTNNGGYPIKYKHAMILLRDEWVTSSQYDGIVKMTFTIPKSVVSSALVKAGMSDLKSNDIIYLHGIFQVTHNGKNYGSKKYDLPSITNAEHWANPDDFEDRFDIKVIYKAPNEPVGIQYKTSSGAVIETNTLPESKWVIPGSTVSFALDTEKTYSGKKYRLYKSYIRYYGLQTAIQGYGRNTLNGDSLSDVMNRNIRQRVGGVQFVGIMKEVKDQSSETEGSYQVNQMEPLPYGEIAADARGKPQFNVQDGIPTTENLYINVFTQRYLLAYEYEKITGKKQYTVTVKRNYSLSWKENGKQKTDTQSLQKTVTITRTYSYWKLKKLEYYKIKDAIIQNGALPGGKKVIRPPNGMEPSALYFIYSEKEHLKEPSYQKTITLPSESIQGADSCPALPDENFESYADESIGEIQVKNDMFSFDGKNITTAQWKEKETDKPCLTSEEVPETEKNDLYQNGLTIPAELANGIYETDGIVEYQAVELYQTSQPPLLTFAIEELSSVTVHTPVVCEAEFSDARKYCQLIKPDNSKKQLVLDQSFHISIPTVGEHLYIDGYGYRDYEKYTQSREVKIPFDVYLGTECIPAGTWIPFSCDTMTFYVPVWVKERTYQIECRAFSINAAANDGLYREEETANLDREHYTATCSFDVQVSGRVYGMKLVDISDYPLWRSVFREENSLHPNGTAYYSGIGNQNGEKTGVKPIFTFPLLPGSHPTNKEAGAVHIGFASRFILTTVGEMYNKKDYIQITPSFFWISKNGKERKEVDVYYKETIHGIQNMLVKTGSALDLANIKYFSLGDPYFSVPEEELTEKSILTGKDKEELSIISSPMFTFHHILLSDNFRTYLGKKHWTFHNRPNWIAQSAVSKSVQKWYGEYYLPSQIYVVKKGFDLEGYWKKHGGFTLRESCFLKTGYLLVHFDIETIQNETPYLSYSNTENEISGYCNMWKTELFQNKKIDSRQNTFSFQEGDYLLYDLEKRASLDYAVSGTH